MTGKTRTIIMEEDIPEGKITFHASAITSLESLETRLECSVYEYSTLDAEKPVKNNQTVPAPARMLNGHCVALAGDIPYPYTHSDITDWIHLHGGQTVDIGSQPSILILGDDPGAARLRVQPSCHLVKMNDLLLAMIGNKSLKDIPNASPVTDLPDNYGVF